MPAIGPESKILIVDDFETVRFVLKRTLSELNCKNSEEAENGQEAWEKLMAAVKQKTPFDVVFCDWNMPVLTGLQLLERVRQDPATKHLVFVMVTAESERQNIAKANTFDVTEYIVKPFSPNSLGEVISKLNARLDKKSNAG